MRRRALRARSPVTPGAAPIFLSLFAGIGGFDRRVVGTLMSKRTGWRVGTDEAAANQLVVTHAIHMGSAGTRGADHETYVWQQHDSNVGPIGTLRRGNGDVQSGVPFTTESSGIRRLTPTECERLQGFPDGWTCLCLPRGEWSADPEGAAEWCQCPDSPRYCALGNAVTVPVAEWLGQRLLGAMMGA